MNSITRNFLTVLVLFAALCPIGSKPAAVSVSTNAFIPNNSFSATASFEYRLSERTAVNPYLGVGYSVSYYNKGESRALIYGPSVEIGLYRDFSNGKSMCQLRAGIEGVYSNFPEIFHFLAEADFFKDLKNGKQVILGLGFLTLSDDPLVKLKIGIRRTLK